jgi:hypothetical protein
LLSHRRPKPGDGDNHVDFAFDELPGKCAKPIRLLGGKTVLNLYGFAVHITEIAKYFRQRTQIDIFFLSVCSMPKDADARYLFGL